MNWSPLPIASLVLAVLFLGCRPERMQEWHCQNVAAERGLYPPTLISQAGRIRVLLLPPDRSDPAVVADGLRADFYLNPRVAKHSFRKQQFANDNGVRGLCVSYLQSAEANGGEIAVENSHYLVKNRAGRCVVINYLASTDGVDTSGIHRMLRTSLSLQ